MQALVNLRHGQNPFWAALVGAWLETSGPINPDEAGRPSPADDGCPHGVVI